MTGEPTHTASKERMAPELMLLSERASQLSNTAWTRSCEVYIFIGKSSLQDNFIKTIVHLKVYVF